MADAGGFTEAVRQELARQPLPQGALARSELTALAQLGGTVTFRGGARPQDRMLLEVRTSSGAVARRAFALLAQCYEQRAELVVHAPGGMRRRSTYAVRLDTGAREVGADLGLLDDAGHPVEPVIGELAPAPATAYLRGAFLACGSLSSPGRQPHLEITVRSADLAHELASLAGGVLGSSVSTTGGERPRVVVKSGATIGELLTAIGATGAFLAWDERRLRRQLRGDATRLANADTANVRRAVEAAAAQVAAVEEAIAHHGWEALDEDLRAVALARLANPAATLTELGQLLDPPMAKSAVHRRMKRLERLSGGPAST